LNVRPIRILYTALIPLCALGIALLWLHGDARADQGGAARLDAAAAASWPPSHQNLSDSADKDSGNADIDADQDRIVVVWAEGKSAHELNGGVIKLGWHTDRDSAWRTRIVSQQNDGFAHYQPAVALWGDTAHVVWVRTDVQGSDAGNSRINYTQCQLDTGICSGPSGVSPEDGVYARLTPDVAVDADGTPHVVWVRQDRQLLGRIRYNNRKGAQWNTPEAVSGGSLVCLYSQHSPALAVDSAHVYVVWDEDVSNCPYGHDAGIYFRQRDQIALPSGPGIWRPGGTPWGKPLSVPDSEIAGDPAAIDGFPAIDVGAGRAYVTWERLAYSQTLPVYGAVYTYSLPYRVYTGTTPYTDWWPGGIAADQWAVLPFTSTSATDMGTYYGGLHPSLKLVGPTPYIVWHQWESPLPMQSSELDVLAQLPDEQLVNQRNPYRVAYATHRPGTDSWDLEQARSSWVSKTLRTQATDRILASPALALSTVDNGRSYQIHVALHRRGAFVAADRSFGWDVWYTNDSTVHQSYLPILLKRGH
jgi:hypothetical protein